MHQQTSSICSQKDSMHGADCRHEHNGLIDNVSCMLMHRRMKFVKRGRWLCCEDTFGFVGFVGFVGLQN
jgi:hypothetical protein